MNMFVGRSTSDMDPPGAGNESDFEFDEMPEDDLDFRNEVSIDAINDETFGGEVSGIPDDLEKFSMQTATLRLDDVAAPDPLSLPMPAFPMFGDVGTSKDTEFESTDKNVKNIWEFNPSNDKNYDLWGSIFESPAAQAAPSTSNMPSFANIARGKSPGPIGSKPIQKRPQNGSAPVHQHIDSEAQIENGRPAAFGTSKSQGAPPAPPGFPSGSGVMSVADLEKRMLNESTVINRGVPPPNVSSAQPYPRNHFPPELAQKLIAAQVSLGRPPVLPTAFANMPPGRMPWLPGMPMMPPPGMRVPPPRYPPFGIPPGNLMATRPPHLPPSHHDTNRQQQSFNNQNNFDQMSVASDHSRGSTQRHKKPGMPSGRTISDFAFDPYAGFMSRKEREWLIRIQLLQCNGSGHPEEDDFYYHNWKMKNGIKSNDIKKKLDGDYYSFDIEKDRPHTYVPPNFQNTLGRPTHLTASLPRQIIDIHQDHEHQEDLQ